MSVFIVRANTTLITLCIHLLPTICSAVSGHHQVDFTTYTVKQTEVEFTEMCVCCYIFVWNNRISMY
jgi:hypothetical protein